MRISLNRILLAFVAVAFMSNSALAQRDNDQRTVTTKIADLLAVQPAQSEQELNANMEAVASLGADGLLQLTLMLSEPGEGDNTQLEFALGGFSRYAANANREDLKNLGQEVFCKALSEMEAWENKAFLMRQFEFVGTNESVACLEAYLNDEHLAAPSAKALVRINTQKSNQALLQGLRKATDNNKNFLVNSLGETAYGPAETEIRSLAKSADPQLRKLALHSLAKIADPASVETLYEAAKNNEFGFGNDNATASYLFFTERLIENGEQEVAQKAAKRLFDNTNTTSQVHTRSAALKLLVDIQKQESLDLLLDAVEDDNAEYRAAALKLAGDYLTPSATKKWVKKMRRSDNQVKAEIITMLGMNQATDALPRILKELRRKDKDVKIAAIWAVGRMGDTQALSKLLKTLKKADAQEIAAVREALLIMDADGLTNEIAAVLPKQSVEARAALIHVLGKRAASDKINEVFVYVEDENQEVRLETLIALEQMVSADHLSKLFPLLRDSDDKTETAAIQKIIGSAIARSENQDRQVSLVLEEMQTAPADKKSRYFAILSELGGQTSLEAVVSEFDSGNAVTKAAAVAALSNWSDETATAELFRIVEENPKADYKDQAFKGFTRAVSNSNATDDQKVLELRKIMELATTDDQKKNVITEIGKRRTFPALVYAGELLDDDVVQQEAAVAVMNIGLNTDYYGNVVRELMEKTIEVLAIPDSDYLKESMRKHLNEMPEGDGIVALFNGEDLSGWKGLVGNPISRSEMSARELEQAQEKADTQMREGWIVEDGAIIFTGEGNNIATEKKYGDIEMFVDWMIYDDGHMEGDGGIYLRGTPQVQIWDTARVDVGAEVGSGGLYNNQANPSKPLKVADNPLDQWNTFHILMQGDRVTVKLNGELVTDNVILENYWNRELPIFSEEQIELQAHGSRVAYRDIYIREIPRAEPFELSAEEKRDGFQVLFDGTNMHHWQGNTTDYIIENGEMVVRPEGGSGGNLFTKEEYEDVVFRFEFKLTPGANNGLGIRAPLEGDAAYEGIELQILDDDADVYRNLEEYQYHGSMYGIAKAERGHLKPMGQWNYQEVTVKGTKVKVVLNGTTILDTDFADARDNGTLDGLDHPGLRREKGHIGFLGHGSEVWFKNIRVKELK